MEKKVNTGAQCIQTQLVCDVELLQRWLEALDKPNVLAKAYILVVKPDGRILLLDHVRIDRPIVGRVMNWLNPLIVRICGANVNRRTVESVEHLGPMRVVKLIVARPKKQ